MSSDWEIDEIEPHIDTEWEKNTKHTHIYGEYDWNGAQLNESDEEIARLV